jgi:DNA-binding NarL/FixJ family response regulator
VTAHIIRKLYPEIAVLVLSALIDPAARSTAEEIGVSGYLRKDHNVDHVVSALDVIAAGGVVFDSLLSRPVTAQGARSTNSTYYLTPRKRRSCLDRGGPGHHSDVQKWIYRRVLSAAM